MASRMPGQKQINETRYGGCCCSPSLPYTQQFRAEAVTEQVRLELECRFQTGHCSKNLLYASVNLDQIIHIHTGKLHGFLNLSVFRFQDFCQCFLLPDGFGTFPPWNVRSPGAR